MHHRVLFYILKSIVLEMKECRTFRVSIIVKQFQVLSSDMKAIVSSFAGNPYIHSKYRLSRVIIACVSTVCTFSKRPLP